MDENRNEIKAEIRPASGNGNSAEDRKDRKNDKLKTPIRIYILILILVTVAAAVIGTSVYVTPVVRKIGSMVSLDLKDIMDAGSAVINAGDVKDAGEKVGEMIGKGAGKLNENLSAGKETLDSYEIETGSWNQEKEAGITRISVDVNYINLTIRSGEALGAEWKCRSILVPDIRMDGDTLKVTQTGEDSLSFRLTSGFELSELAATLILTVPEDVYLEDLNIDVDAGNIIMNGVKSRKAEVKADFGNIVLANGEFGKLEVGADCGNVELLKSTAEGAEIEADLGRVVVSESSIGFLTVQADCGAIDVNGIVSDEVELRADCGSISASGEFDALTADCSLGSISVMTVKPESEVWLKLHADLGEVTVNGREY